MAKETDQFLRNSLFQNGGTFADRSLADYTFVNGPLAAFYGMPDAGRPDDWVKVKLDHLAAGRASLTQASLLATMAKEEDRPVRRGKFVLNQILCRTVTPPPPEIVAMFKPLDPSQTMRVQFDRSTATTRCARRATSCSIHWACRSSTTTASALARHRSRDGDLTRAATWTGKYLRRRPGDVAAAGRHARRARLLRDAVDALRQGKTEGDTD